MITQRRTLNTGHVSKHNDNRFSFTKCDVALTQQYLIFKLRRPGVFISLLVAWRVSLMYFNLYERLIQPLDSLGFAQFAKDVS